jgi:Zn-dependent protease with chaperone function
VTSPSLPDRRLRHPAEVPLYAIMVALNLIIVAAIVTAASVLPFVPDAVRDSNWGVAIRSAFIALLLLFPALVIIRETQRASIRGGAVELSPTQFADIYRTAEEFAGALGLRRRPVIYLTNGNGTLNAFAAQAHGYDYVVLANELFANLYGNNREGLRFILGHELGHVRLHHTGLWYNLAIAYSARIPLLGPALSRLREYSCDRHGAHLCPTGVNGLVLLTAGRYVENDVDVDELLAQGRRLHGFWTGVAQLPMSHPFTVRRIEHLFRLGLLREQTPKAKTRV